MKFWKIRGCTVEGQSLRAGIGLHIGTVMYGNVGSADRLDFTVIGPATNMAFRLEALTKQLGRPVLASHAFADAVDMPLVSLGKQPIRGFQDVRMSDYPSTASQRPEIQQRRPPSAADVSVQSDRPGCRVPGFR